MNPLLRRFTPAQLATLAATGDGPLATLAQDHCLKEGIRFLAPKRYYRDRLQADPVPGHCEHCGAEALVGRIAANGHLAVLVDRGGYYEKHQCATFRRGKLSSPQPFMPD